MQIPKTVSTVAYPGEPSLLTSIPPEIRNAIYEVLFKREGPVLLHNAEAYHALEPERKNFDTDSEYKAYLEDFYDQYEREIGADHEFQHKFHEGISLLICCRQVYHEAVGVLYSKNTFIISRVPDRHDGTENNEYDDGDNVYRNSEDYFQMIYAPRWLSALGSQFSFLSKVVIDMDCICPDSCDYQMGMVDLLPLIRLLWGSPEAIKVVKFGRGGMALTIHENEEVHDTNMAMMLNNILFAITIEDMLSIKRYGYSNCLLKSVVIHTAAYMGVDDGYVLFETNNERPGRRFDFSILDNGRILKPKQQQPRQLITLPTDIMQRIYSFACVSHSGIIFDLDTGVLRGLNMAPFHLNRSLYEFRNLANHVSRISDTLVKMTSTEPFTDFNQFCSWKNLLKECDSMFNRNLFHSLIYVRDRTSPLLVSMEFVLAMPMTLSDIRIDILGLIHPFKNFQHEDGHLDMALRFMIKSPRGSGRLTEETRVALTKIQKDLFLLLSDIMNTYGNVPLPNIWIDGRGNILYAELPTLSKDTTQKYTFRHSELTRAEICQRGYHMATILNPKFIEYWRASWPALSSDDSLVFIWDYLRSTHWRDWGARGVCGS